MFYIYVPFLCGLRVDVGLLSCAIDYDRLKQYAEILKLFVFLQ